MNRSFVFALLSLTLMPSARAQTWSLETAAAPYKGAKVTLATPAWRDAIAEIAKDFTRRTGINVEVVQVPGSQIIEKTVLDLRNRGTAYDLIAHTAKRPYTEAKLFLPLNSYLSSSKLTDPKWNKADFVNYKQFATDPNNVTSTVAMPFGASGMALYYRKDLFATPKYQAAFKSKYKYALAAPRTWQQVQDIATFFNTADFKSFAGSKGAGIALAGVRGEALTWYFSFLTAGAALNKQVALPGLLDADNKAVFKPYSAQALNTLADLTKSAQSGVLQADDTAAREVFAGGGAAMVITWDSFLSRLNTGDISGKWALAPIPKRGLDGGWALGVNPNSRSPQAAFLLAQYLSSKEADLKMFELAGRYPSRESTYATAAYKAMNPYADVLARAKKQGVPQVDNAVTAQINNTVSETVSLMLAGQLTSDAAAKRMNDSVDRALEDAGY